MENPSIKPLAQAATQSANVVDGNLAQLKTLFPDAFKEGGIDFDVLKQLLGGQVDEREEKYGLNWHGKRRARQIALTPSTGTLRPCPAESVDWDTTQNLMIEGDNLEVLKLLQKSYAGKVKMIYIDPPYNTGKDFVYPDNFQDNIKNYLELTGQVDGQGRKLSSNTEASGRFHTDWLNMMYPRLKLARNLLREDGVIFVSLDDGEIDNLRQIAKELFGEENFVAQILWKKRSTPPNDKTIGANHDYIALLCKDHDNVKLNLKARTQEQIERYKNPDLHIKGSWAPGDLMANVKGGRYVESLNFPITNPKNGVQHLPSETERGNWRFAKDTIDALILKNEIYFGEDGNGRPKLKRFLSDVKEGVTYATIWDFVAFNTEGSAEMQSLFGNSSLFESPKPTGLIEELLRLGTEKNDLVLDFFGGSGTTAHAVMSQNSSDSGERQFILVQLPEHLDILKAEQKTAAEFCDTLGKPRNIAELTKERLRRAATKIRAAYASKQRTSSQLSLENEPKTAPQPLDLGFKVFKLDTSNIRAWNPNPDELADTLMAHTEHLAAGRSEADVLYEVLLKQGLDLAVPIASQTIAGHTVHSVGAGALMVCLAKDVAKDMSNTSTSSVRTGGESLKESAQAMTEASVTATNAEALALGIAEWHTQLAAALGQTPAEQHTRVVLRDSLFDGDVAKTNVCAILAQRGLEDVRSL